MDNETLAYLEKLSDTITHAEGLLFMRYEQTARDMASLRNMVREKIKEIHDEQENMAEDLLKLQNDR